MPPLRPQLLEFTLSGRPLLLNLKQRQTAQPLQLRLKNGDPGRKLLRHLARSEHRHIHRGRLERSARRRVRFAAHAESIGNRADEFNTSSTIRPRPSPIDLVPWRVPEWECPTICVGMDRKEIHVNDNPKQVGRVHGSFRRRRGAERARRASEARRWRRAPGRKPELAEELKALLPDELLDELLAGARSEEEITGPGGLLSQLTKRLVERAIEVELTDHLGYEPHQEPPGGAGNTRNGSTPKTLVTEQGEVRIDTPRDRKGTFEPQIVKKRQRRFEGFDEDPRPLQSWPLDPGHRGAPRRDLRGQRRPRPDQPGDRRGHGRRPGLADPAA